jgi:hypothetical protein
MTLVYYYPPQQPLVLQQSSVPQEVAVACNVACYVCADNHHRRWVAVAMFLLYAVDAALADPLDQVFNQRLVRHDDYSHALFDASQQHEQQALAPSC